MMSLTPRQQDALRFIIGYQEAKDGISPTFKEIGAAIGLTSTSSVSRHLDELERRRALRRLTARPRAIEVLVRLPIPRAPDGEPLHLVRIEGPSA